MRGPRTLAAAAWPRPRARSRSPSPRGHTRLAARGEWITNEKTLLDRAGLRHGDDVLAGLTADPDSLVAAVDAASDLVGDIAG
jgi:hypothetical protein